jgi:hypothetical protein
MSALPSLARAARLVGVPRGALQRKIANGELAFLGGLVSLEELRRSFPDAEARRGTTWCENAHDTFAGLACRLGGRGSAQL